jgi:5-methylcytosine-specific restriction endonuclease McrA
MEKENIISELSKARLTGKYGEPGDHRWVKIWVRDRYCCVYCGVSLLDDIIRMSSAQIDHLLPKYEY